MWRKGLGSYCYFTFNFEIKFKASQKIKRKNKRESKNIVDYSAVQ